MPVTDFRLATDVWHSYDQRGGMSDLERQNRHATLLKVIETTLIEADCCESWTLHDFIAAGLTAHNHQPPRETAKMASFLLTQFAREVLHSILPVIE